MRRTHSLDELRDALTSRAELNRNGLSDRGIRRGLEQGVLERVHHGWFASRALTEDLYPEQRHAVAVLAAHLDGTTAIGAMMGVSAATLRELPLWGLERDAAVHVLLRGTHVSIGRTVIRHHLRYEPEDIGEFAGIPCTSAARTVFDVARMRSFAMAVACADTAMRSEAAGDETHAAARADEFRAGVLAIIDRMPGARGLRLARRVALFADGRAESPGESVARARAFEVGFREFEVQVPVSAPKGGRYFADLGLPEANALLEFDGTGKYLSPELLGDRSTAETVMDEKRREDWIRARTRRTVVRLAARDVATVPSFRKALREHGITMPRQHPADIV